ncbi:MAG: hypothetical protein PUD03_06625 [Lachnospiraceae bacterium]|nr:hypothetical protein [Lachnospiraceae bacterium]
MLEKIRKNYLFVCIIVISLVYCIAWYAEFDGDIIYSDGSLYYQYFSRLFVTHDFVGNGLIKYPLGTTLLQLPFLLVGLVFSKALGIDLENGLSSVFQGCVFVAACFYAFLGMFLLYRLLRERCGQKVAAITCACMIWGTMFPEYAMLKASFSHMYGFFMCTVFVYYIVWYEKTYKDELPLQKRLCMDLLFGAILGINIVIRNTNVIIGFAYLLYNVFSLKDFTDRVKKIFSVKILPQIAGCALVYLFQILSWKIQTGQWILYSYGGESFAYLTNPKIMEVLFSDVKGLFIYSPVLIISILGMITGHKSNKEFALFPCVVFILQTYIISAWWCWWLGCCYGERMYCDVLIIFAFPMADFLMRLEDFCYAECDDIRKAETRKAIYITIYIFIFIFVLFNFMWIKGCHNSIISENMGTWNALHEQFQRFLLK